MATGPLRYREVLLKPPAKRPVRIGILGGIGPESTAAFYRQLIMRLQKRGLINSNEDFPQIIINSVPAPELLLDEITDANLSSYVDGLKQLDAFGVDFIVMVCNTIHLFYEELQGKIKTPILDLREEVRKTIDREKVAGFLILGTHETIRRGLYNFDGVKCIEPNKKEETVLADAIFDFNRGMNRNRQKRNVEMICAKYLETKRVGTIVLGCTELALMIGKTKYKTVNTLDVLTNATIRGFETLRK